LMSVIQPSLSLLHTHTQLMSPLSFIY
jgi:hypothetical protein